MTPAPIVAQSLAVELNMAVTRAYASTFGSGMTAAFEYALKLFRVPLAMLVVPLSHSFLPEVTRYAEDPVKKTNSWAAVVRTSWFMGLASVAATILLLAAREPVVRLLFQRGAFGETSTETVALLLLGCAPIIIGRSVSDFLSRMLFAIGRQRLRSSPPPRAAGKLRNLPAASSRVSGTHRPRRRDGISWRGHAGDGLLLAPAPLDLTPAAATDLTRVSAQGRPVSPTGESSRSRSTTRATLSIT